MCSFHPGINTEVNRLKRIIVAVSNEMVDFNEPYFPFSGIGGQVVYADDSRIGIAVFPGVPSSHRVSIELCCRHRIASSHEHSQQTTATALRGHYASRTVRLGERLLRSQHSTTDRGTPQSARCGVIEVDPIV